MNEYYETISHFEKRLSRVVEKTIQLETKRRNMFSFKSKTAKLKEEREKLIDEIKSNQTDYFNKGITETRIYEAKSKSLTNRFSHVENNIMLGEAKKVLRTTNGIGAPLWKMYYKVIK